MSLGFVVAVGTGIKSFRETTIESVFKVRLFISTFAKKSGNFEWYLMCAQQTNQGADDYVNMSCYSLKYLAETD